VAAVLGLAATKPDTFSVQRTASIKAPPEKISAVLSDFRGWQAWSPFEKMDPAMKRSFSGADKGRGAVYAWSGNGEAGEGRMEITEASAARVALNLDFTRPMEAHNKVVFALAPKGEATEVTWTMSGPAPFISKVVQVFCDMDAMVGKYFEEGLASLKSVAEKT
jgi:hypothetical protein